MAEDWQCVVCGEEYDSQWAVTKHEAVHTVRKIREVLGL